MQRRVDVDRRPARGAHARHGFAQQDAAVGTLECGIGVRKMPPDIAQPRGAQQRVGNGVQQHIGIGMAHQTMRVRDRDTADDQRPAFNQGMHVKALPNAKRNAHSHFSISSKSSGHVTLKLRKAPGTSNGA
ncbi:hypothetical protein D3C78_1500150 [compost metagenome]